MGFVKALDDSGWPVLYARFEGDGTPDEYDRYARWFEACCRRAVDEGARIVIIADTTGGVTVSPDLRRHITESMTRHNAYGYTAAVISSYVALNSTLMRGVMRAMSWVAKEHMGGVKSVASVAAAYEAALVDLDNAGAPPPVTRPAWARPLAS